MSTHQVLLDANNKAYAELTVKKGDVSGWMAYYYVYSKNSTFMAIADSKEEAIQEAMKRSYLIP